VIQYWGFNVSFGEIVVVFLNEADSIENASLFFVQITQFYIMVKLLILFRRA
jgi:hypothetical protein